MREMAIREMMVLGKLEMTVEAGMTVGGGGESGSGDDSSERASENNASENGNDVEKGVCVSEQNHLGG